MKARKLKLDGAWEISQDKYVDERGHLLVAFSRTRLLEATGIDFSIAQSNISVSNRGAVRGIHYGVVPPGQAKYFQCLSGTLLDVIIDLRVGSPTFGEWVALELDGEKSTAVHIPLGFGHAFQALTDRAIGMYLCSNPFEAVIEHAIDPLDEDLALPWHQDMRAILSPRDAAAPSWDEARRTPGQLPTYADCMRWTV